MPEPPPEAVEALFQQAADLAPERRGELLDERCNGDPDLRAAVEELLHFDAKARSATDFLQGPAADLRAALPPRAEAVPSRIGHYRIVRRHGEGGMGTVYEAEQDNPRRTVALKVIRPGLLSPELVRRFRNEAQILGRLQHPGIAQVHEAGMSEIGQPFLAMEFIRGVPLDEYVRVRGLDPPARLELLARVCDAVQHAHDRGVVHRDLKPGNILVEESGQPRVLDFGVAHATAADLLTTSTRTQTGQLLGTLGYMSPEQIAADPGGLDGRSDVYTLGVILFELLAHRLPYHLDQLPVHEVARVIDQQEPSRLGSIDRRYRGDVEVIVARALEKDKKRRYASAGDLASDIRRYLRGEPIRARKVSAPERSWRWARRNPFIAALGGALAGVLVVVTIASLVAAGRFARLAKDRGLAVVQERWERYRSNIAEASAAQQLQNSSTGARPLAAAPEEHRNWEWRHLHSQLDGASLVLPVPEIVAPTLRLSPDSRQIAVGNNRGEVYLFEAATGRAGPVLRGHAGRVESLEYSPDGRQLASGARDGTIRLWDPETGRPQFVLRGEGTGSAYPRYRSDGKRIASFTRPAVAGKLNYRLWDATTGRQLAILGESPDTGSNEGAAFRPDGERVVAPAGEFLRTYHAETGRQLSVLGPLEWPVDRIVFSPDGRRFVVNHTGGASPLSLRDGDTGEVVAVPSDQQSPAYVVAFSPDGSRLATTGIGREDAVVRLREAGNGKPIRTMPGHTNRINAFAFSPDGTRLVSVSSDQTGRLWDGQTGQEVAVLRGHTGVLWGATFSPDGTRLATASEDGTLRLWDAGTGALIAVLRGHRGVVGPPAFTRGGSRLISASDDGTLRVWDMTMVERNGVLRGHTHHVSGVAFRADGKEVASAGWDGTVRLWDPDTGRQTGLLHYESVNMPPARYGIEHDIMSAVAYSPDGRRLATANRALGVALWKAVNAEREHTWPGPTGAWNVNVRVAFSPDGTLVAAGSAAGPVSLWDVATGERVAELGGPERGVGQVAFAPGGETLASAGLDGTIRLWDVATRKALTTLRGHAARVNQVAFSPDGGMIASGSDDATVLLWDSRSHALDSTVPIGSKVKGVAFSPDGTRLALGCADTTIRLIDVAKRQEVVTLRGHTDFVQSVAWSPDGTRLVSGSGDRTIRVWDSLSIEARARASRENPTRRDEHSERPTMP
jgi:WD40 repeat protein